MHCHLLNIEWINRTIKCVIWTEDNLETNLDVDVLAAILNGVVRPALTLMRTRTNANRTSSAPLAAIS